MRRSHRIDDNATSDVRLPAPRRPSLKRVTPVVILVALASLPVSAQTADEGSITEFLKAYEAAFNAKDLAKLATFYHPDVTVYEGGSVNRGWADYRDHHLGPELKEVENLQLATTDLTAHLADGGRRAWVTSSYTLGARAKERDIDSIGLQTLILVRGQDGDWKIRHSHSSSRRRAAQ